MQHLHEHILCAVDCETTGLDPFHHEMFQLAIIPLDILLKPRKDIIALSMYLKPENPELYSEKALQTTKMTMDDLMVKGIDREKAKEVFARLISDYPKSSYAQDAKRMFDRINLSSKDIEGMRSIDLNILEE